MDKHSQALVDTALERAADQLGDLTRPVMDAFYARFPDARASFEFHWPGKADRLEAEMVGNSLYYLMTWHERRSEAEIAFGSSVPHHHHTLKVPVEWYSGLIDATIAVIVATTPTDAPEEAKMWQDMRASFDRLVTTSL